ncbi:MAG: 1-(5-phosphoribosyl)-5-[(5-phosphoribosylamino)methylideneamino]imidazole-4-carboxamide isomerase [Steroidobacteraceae bacterium]
MQLIPAIDLKDGRCVRLFQGNFAAETQYSTNPVEILDRYVALGAERIHVVDLDGAKDGSQANHALITSFAAKQVAQLQVGGGLRTLKRVQTLLSQGVQRAVIGSIAVSNPDEVIRWSQAVSTEQLVLAFDVRIDNHNTPFLTTHGWVNTSTVSLWSSLERYVDAGFTQVLCTDIARDGALTGPNIALYTEAVRRFPSIRWQASGGVASARDLHELRDCGVAAVISGKALLENKISAEELQPFLRNA